MHPVVLITAKDLRQRLRDSSLLVYALLLPLGLAFIFNLVFSGVGSNDPFRYAVVNQDHGAAAAQFYEHALKPAEQRKILTSRTVGTPASAVKLIEDGKITAAFVIPPGFSAAQASGSVATLEIVGSVDAPISVEVARSLAMSFIAEIRAIRLAVAVASGGAPDPARAAALGAKAAALPGPIAVEDTAAAKKELTPTTYLAAGMAVFFLFFTVQFGVSGLLAERELGTLPRLLAAPVSRASILGAKLLVSVIVGTTSMAILVVATGLLFGARWGDPLGVASLVLAGVLAATGIMALVAALARTYEQAGQWQAVIAVALGALGGAFFSVAQVGGPLAVISLFTPHHWFLQGLADLAGGGGINDVLPAVAALLTFAVVSGLVAMLGLRRSLS